MSSSSWSTSQKLKLANRIVDNQFLRRPKRANVVDKVCADDDAQMIVSLFPVREPILGRLLSVETASDELINLGSISNRVDGLISPLVCA